MESRRGRCPRCRGGLGQVTASASDGWLSVGVRLFRVKFDLQKALAEVSIIVLGVLIAFGVNSWNSRRIDRNIEAEYLARLADDARQNAKLAVLLNEALNRKNALLDQLARVGKDPWKLSPSDTVAEITALGAATDLGWVFPTFRTTTFDEMRSTGRLSLIEDVALRTALREYDVDLRETVQRIDARRTGFPALVYSLLRPGQMVERADLNSALKPIATEDASLDDRVLTTLASDRFEGLLNAERNFSDFAIQLVKPLKQESEQLAATLDDALNH